MQLQYFQFELLWYTNTWLDYACAYIYILFTQDYENVFLQNISLLLLSQFGNYIYCVFFIIEWVIAQTGFRKLFGSSCIHNMLHSHAISYTIDWRHEADC